MSRSKHAILMTTVASRADAKRLAELAIQKRLAACVQVVPGVRSTYRWKGKIEETPEFLVLFKTAKKALPGLLKAIKATHPYSVPELVAVPVCAGSKVYLSWVDAETAVRRSRVRKRKK